MESNNSNFSFNFGSNPFNMNFIVSEGDNMSIQHPIENTFEEIEPEFDFVEFEVNSFVNIALTENSDDETAGAMSVETIEHLVESYRYSRDEIIKRIKSCNYLLTKRGTRPSRVYWVGQIFREVKQMLTEIVGLSHVSDKSVEVEADTYTLSRDNFLNNLFWTKIDLTLFNDKQYERTVNITYDEFEFIKRHHCDFLEKNYDLVGKTIKSRIGNSRMTPKLIVDAYLFIYYTNELFR